MKVFNRWKAQIGQSVQSVGDVTALKLDCKDGWNKSKIFYVHPNFGEMIQFDEHFFKWVETTN